MRSWLEGLGLGLLVLALVREGDADVREEPLDASKVSSILSLTRADCVHTSIRVGRRTDTRRATLAAPRQR
jgi:hypothetical protein